jgi:hypothetical protein
MRDYKSINFLQEEPHPEMNKPYNNQTQTNATGSSRLWIMRLTRFMSMPGGCNE